MKREWSIRTRIHGDEPAIYSLFKAVYPARDDAFEQWLAVWRWMYDDNPAGDGKVWLAEHHGTVVGMSGASLARIKVGGEVLTGFQSTDTMTHPDYQGQGIYTTLAREVYDEASREGITVGFRFPNRTSRPIAISKLGWLDLACMKAMFKPLNWSNILRPWIGNKALLWPAALAAGLLQGGFCRSGDPPVVSGLALNRVVSFDARYDDLWQVIASQYQLMLVRDSAYLNWRYVAVPGTSYTTYAAEVGDSIQGYVVLRLTQIGQTRVGIIFDCVARSEAVARNLVAKAVDYFRQEGSDNIYCSFVANRSYVRALRKNGFIARPFRGNQYICVYAGSPEVSKELLTRRENWLVQTGDSDWL